MACSVLNSSLAHPFVTTPLPFPPINIGGTQEAELWRDRRAAGRADGSRNEPSQHRMRRVAGMVHYTSYIVHCSRSGRAHVPKHSLKTVSPPSEQAGTVSQVGTDYIQSRHFRDACFRFRNDDHFPVRHIMK